jgi:hypothetical protein
MTAYGALSGGACVAMSTYSRFAAEGAPEDEADFHQSSAARSWRVLALDRPAGHNAWHQTV